MQNIIVKSLFLLQICTQQVCIFESSSSLIVALCKQSWVVCNELDSTINFDSDASPDTSAHDNTN